jgi:hypothetical protein
MTPQKIRVPWLALALILSMDLYLAPLPSVAQSCSGTIQTVTYSTTLAGTGSGTATDNSLHQYYSADGYTLISAVMASYITTSSTVTFQNSTNVEQDFIPSISRTDVVKLNGTMLTNGNSSYNFPYTELYALGSPDDNITYGPQNVFNNTLILYDSIATSSGTLASFQGMGTLNLSYKSTTSLSVPLGVNPSASVSDNITLSVTYYFCNPIVLSSNILTFTVNRQDVQTVAIDWIVANETAGRRYDIEVSTDGKEFVYYRSQPADPSGGDASYIYKYPISPGSRGKLYFRLKQVEAAGTAAYSPVRIIDLNDSAATSRFSIYPNPPSDFINVVFPFAGSGWQVDILATDGGLVQRNYFNNSSTGRVNFTRKLASGAYFVRARELQSAEMHSASFVIR